MALIIEKIMSIFLIMAVGFIANRVGVLPQEGNGFLTNLLIKVITPCMICSSITSKELTGDTFLATIQTIGLAAAFFVVAVVIGYLFCRYVLHINPEDIGTYTFAFGSMNSGFMGFPITLALFGADVLYFMVLHNMVLTIYTYSAGPSILRLGSGEKKSFNGKAFLLSFCNINAIVAFISIFMLFTGLHLPEILFQTTETIGSATVPVSMLLVGMQLGTSNPVKMIKDKKMVALSFVRMFLLPVLTFFAIDCLPLAVNVKICLIFAAVFPAAVGAVPVTTLEGKNGLASAETVAFTTLISVATVPLFAAFLMGYYGV